MIWANPPLTASINRFPISPSSEPMNPLIAPVIPSIRNIRGPRNFSPIFATFPPGPRNGVILPTIFITSSDSERIFAAKSGSLPSGPKNPPSAARTPPPRSPPRIPPRPIPTFFAPSPVPFFKASMPPLSPRIASTRLFRSLLSSAASSFFLMRPFSSRWTLDKSRPRPPPPLPFPMPSTADENLSTESLNLFVVSSATFAFLESLLFFL